MIGCDPVSNAPAKIFVENYFGRSKPFSGNPRTRRSSRRRRGLFTPAGPPFGRLGWSSRPATDGREAGGGAISSRWMVNARRRPDGRGLARVHIRAPPRARLFLKLSQTHRPRAPVKGRRSPPGGAARPLAGRGAMTQRGPLMRWSSSAMAKESGRTRTHWRGSVSRLLDGAQCSLIVTAPDWQTALVDAAPCVVCA